MKAATKGKAYQSYLILYSDISEVFFPSPSQVSLDREKKAETLFLKAETKEQGKKVRGKKINGGKGGRELFCPLLFKTRGLYGTKERQFQSLCRQYTLSLLENCKNVEDIERLVFSRHNVRNIIHSQHVEQKNEGYI